MINLLEYRSDRHLQNSTGGELEWARAILFNNFTDQWCQEHSDTVYAMEGYFPPNDRKTSEKVAFINYPKKERVVSDKDFLKASLFFDNFLEIFQNSVICKEVKPCSKNSEF